jgi:hypothetical protein
MLTNQKQLETSKRKLGELEVLYRECKEQPGENETVREQSLRSIKRAINLLKEEIVRYESEASVKK